MQHITENNILVTGGTGFLGREFIEQKKEKYRIYSTCRSDHPEIAGVKWFNLDLTKKEDFLTAYENLSKEGITAIVHIGGSSPNRAYAEGNFDATILGTQYLLELGKKLKIKKFVFVSSIVVTLPYSGPYADSKRIAEKQVLESGLNYTIFRPETIIGPQALDLGRAVKALQTRKFFPIFGSGENLTQPIDSEDLVEMIDHSLSSAATDNKIYPAVGPDIIAFKDFLNRIALLKGNKIRFVKIPIFLGRLIVKAANIINPRWGLNDERLNFVTCSRQFTLDHMKDFPHVKLRTLGRMSFPEAQQQIRGKYRNI